MASHHWTAPRSPVHTFTPEAQATLDGFADEIEGGFPRLPSWLLPHVAWLPELCERIAVMLWILDLKNGPVEGTSVVDAVAVVKWLGRQHLHGLLLGHPSTDTADGADIPKAAEVMLHKIRVKGPLTRRELRRSYDNPRSEWFLPALEYLLKHEKVWRNAENQLEVWESARSGSGGGGGGEISGSNPSSKERSPADNSPGESANPADSHFRQN